MPRASLAKLHIHLTRVGIDRSLNFLTRNFQKTTQLLLVVVLTGAVAAILSVVKFTWPANTWLNCQDKASMGNGEDKLHLVVMFYNMLDGDWRSKHFKKAGSEKWEKRMGEVAECIRRNLAHPMVATIHYLYHNVTTMNAYLAGLNLPHREKLHVHEANATTVGDFMRFASDNLQGRVVMVLNSDGFLGDGFDKLDFPYLMNNRVVYALTRHWVGCKGPGSCHDGAKYQGSHDGYIFHLKEPLPGPFFAEINIDPTHATIEDVIMGAFHHFLKYTVRNPCKILKLMHNHCSKVRPGKELRFKLHLGPHATRAEFSGLYI